MGITEALGLGRPKLPLMTGNRATLWYLVAMEKTTLYLPRDLLARYAALSRRQQRSEAEIMREALEAYVHDEDQPLPSWVGKLDDDEVTSENFDEWLRANWKPE
jgi:hypothetical protein